MSKYFSPAKINWFLHITGRRDDGYHLLETVFQRIDWCDELEITTRDDGQIVLSGDLSGVEMTKIWLIKLRQLYKARKKRGANIHLTKNIPTGAGLGGGSSNAATVLLALNELWALHLPNVELQKIGLTLGADVPFFVSGYNAAFASGVGEVLSQLHLPSREILLVNPNVHIATAVVFNHPELVRSHAPLDAVPNDFTLLSNDLQAASFAIAQEIRSVYDALLEVVPDALVRMSGSGACVFAVPHNDTQREVLKKWQAQNKHALKSKWTLTMGK